MSALLITVVLAAACGDGNQRGLRQLTDEVQAVRTSAQQGDLTGARQQLDDLRVTVGVLRGRGRITAEDLAAFRDALDRVETELGATERSLLASSGTTPPPTTTVAAATSLPPTTSTTSAPPTTAPPPPPEDPGKRKGREEDD